MINRWVLLAEVAANFPKALQELELAHHSGDFWISGKANQLQLHCISRSDGKHRFYNKEWITKDELILHPVVKGRGIKL